MINLHSFGWLRLTPCLHQVQDFLPYRFTFSIILGCILCELLTGYPLLPGEDEGKYKNDDLWFL